MKRFLTAGLFGCLTCFVICGCTEKATVTKDTTIKTPGGSTEVKTTQEIKKSGDHKD